MKAILSFILLSVVITSGAYFGWYYSPAASESFVENPSEDSNLEKKSATLNLAPRVGEQSVYAGLVTYRIRLPQSAESTEIQMVFDLTIRNYIKDAKGMLRGMTASNLQFDHHEDLAKDLLHRDHQLFFIENKGYVTKLLIPKGSHDLMANVLKGIALQLQLGDVKSGNFSLPSTWNASEESPNGSYQVQFALNGSDQTPLLTKKYLNIPGHPELEIQTDSQVRYSINEEGNVENITYEFGISHRNQALSLSAQQKVNLNFIRRDFHLPLTNPITQGSFLSSSPSELSSGLGDSKKARMEQALGSHTQEQLIDMTMVLEGFDDPNVSELFDKWEAFLYLYPDKGRELISYLRDQIGSENFSIQLNVLMGVLSTMNAAQIESEILIFAKENSGSLDITQQTAFSLAELSQATVSTREHLIQLSQHGETDFRNAGMLGLGILGQQEPHTQAATDYLREKLKRAPTGSQAAPLAALNNVRNPDNLDILLTYIHSPDEFLAAQTVFGLQHIPTEKAYRAIKSIINTESRESILIEGVKALAGHLDKKDCTEVLRQLILSNHPDTVKIQALNLVAIAPQVGSRMNFLQSVLDHEHQSDKVKDYVRQLVLTF